MQDAQHADYSGTRCFAFFLEIEPRLPMILVTLVYISGYRVKQMDLRHSGLLYSLLASLTLDHTVSSCTRQRIPSPALGLSLSYPSAAETLDPRGNWLTLTLG